MVSFFSCLQKLETPNSVIWFLREKISSSKSTEISSREMHWSVYFTCLIKKTPSSQYFSALWMWLMFLKMTRW